MSEIFVTYQRELTCGPLSNDEVLWVGGALNVLGFVFVFYNTVRAQRLAVRGQLDKDGAMVLPIYNVFLKLLCVALVLRSTLFFVFKGQSRLFNLVEWMMINPLIGSLREGVAVYLVQESGGVDAVRRAAAFGVMWCIVHFLIGLQFWSAQVSDPSTAGLSAAEYWGFHSGSILIIYTTILGLAMWKRHKTKRARASTKHFRASVVPYGAFIWLFFLMFYVTLLKVFPTAYLSCSYAIILLVYYVLWPLVAYFSLRVDSRFWRQIGARLSEAAVSSSLLHSPTQHSLVIDFSRVEMDSKIASGGTAAVCLAMLDGHRQVAVKKFVCTSLTEADAQSYIREVAALAALRHPNILTMYGVCIQPPYMCLVVELMHQGSLFDVLAADREAVRDAEELGRAPTLLLTPLLRLQLLLDACTGLAFLHSRSPAVYHGDIKSLNLLIDKHWNLKLCDFGEARRYRKAQGREYATPAVPELPPESSHSNHSYHSRGSSGSGSGRRTVSTGQEQSTPERVAQLAQLTAVSSGFRDVPSTPTSRRIPGSAAQEGDDPNSMQAWSNRAKRRKGFQSLQLQVVRTTYRTSTRGSTSAYQPPGSAAARQQASSRLRVIDSGITLESRESTDLFKTTPQWSAPECFVEPDKYSAACDVFSMGLVMWEMWAREAPFSQVPPAEVAGVIVSGCRPEIPVGMPGSVVALMSQCWSHNPLSRPSAASLVAALELAVERCKANEGRTAIV